MSDVAPAPRHHIRCRRGEVWRYLLLPGDLVIASAAIRDEGTGCQYLPLAFPAIADPDVTLALRDAARAAGVRHHVGIVQSKDAFYAEWAHERMPLADELVARNTAWKRGGAIGSEMVAALLGGTIWPPRWRGGR